MTVIERLRREGVLRLGTPRSGFRYRYAGRGRRGSPPPAELRRLRALRVPPAWRDVAFSCSPRARVQAVGRDAAGRWQYLYHPAHVRERERRKAARLHAFGRALPRLRAAVRRDLRRRDLSREKVLATMVRILARAFIRPGSECYAAENGSFGLATLRRRHLTVHGDTLRFDFRAKGGKRQQYALRDPQVARVVHRLLALPGVEVFKYCPGGGGAVSDVRRADLSAYVKAAMGDGFSAKDFRTWTATVICAGELARAAAGTDAGRRARTRVICAALDATARQLGNTRAICRASYVSPVLLHAFERGHVVEVPLTDVDELVRPHPGGLHAAERALLALLERIDVDAALPRAA